LYSNYHFYAIICIAKRKGGSMKKVIVIFIFIFFLIFLSACGKDDYNESKVIFDKYEEELSEEGYILNKISATNNVAGWLEITDKDVIDIHRTASEDQDGVAYFFLFPKLRTAEKWYKKIKVEVENTNYEAYLDGHYVIVVLGYDLSSLIEDLNN